MHFQCIVVEFSQFFKLRCNLPIYGQYRNLRQKGTLKNPMLNTFHGDAHKSSFSNALIIMGLRT